MKIKLTKDMIIGLSINKAGIVLSVPENIDEACAKSLIEMGKAVSIPEQDDTRKEVVQGPASTEESPKEDQAGAAEAGPQDTKKAKVAKKTTSTKKAKK